MSGKSRALAGGDREVHFRFGEFLGAVIGDPDPSHEDLVGGARVFFHAQQKHDGSADEVIGRMM